MAKVVLNGPKHLPSAERYMTFDENDLNSGDWVDVVESMGRAADTITIETDASSDLSIRFNTRLTKRSPHEYQGEQPYGWHLLGVPVGKTVTHKTGTDSIEIGNGSSAVTYTLNDLPLRDVEFTWTAGTFSVLLS